jgi:hypothetical protein
LNLLCTLSVLQLAMGFVREDGGALVFPSGGSLAPVEAAAKKFRELQAEAQVSGMCTDQRIATLHDDFERRHCVKVVGWRRRPKG